MVDNGGNLGGAVTGDTVFAIPDALTRTTAVSALGREVVPAGSIPFAMDVLALADGTVLVTGGLRPVGSPPAETERSSEIYNAGSFELDDGVPALILE